jgi:FkbM family methyltransferase
MSQPGQAVNHTNSYQGQDLFALEMLEGLRGGFFLDSGASDGVKGSNSRLLETVFGWHGICVEPNENSFELLRRNRNCICLSCCLADKEGPVDFLEAAGVFGGILNEYDPDHLRYACHMLGREWSDQRAPPTVKKHARTLRSILRQYQAPRVIDYWSLDTEGCELTLLNSFPFDEYVFRVLTVEHNETAVRHEIRWFLERQGYAWIRSLGIDDGYVLPEIPMSYTGRSAVWRRGRFY